MEVVGSNLSSSLVVVDSRLVDSALPMDLRVGFWQVGDNREQLDIFEYTCISVRSCYHSRRGGISKCDYSMHVESSIEALLIIFTKDEKQFLEFHGLISS